jgi:lipopolysaccharide/colanic/teichoic acid biosynthesis glycosyltransferase
MFLLKRILDWVAAAVGLLLLSPILVAVAFAILLTAGRPILFRQKRPGHKGVPFEVLKFRTMRQLRPDEVMVNSDEQRLTRLGSLLRRTSLDELPELWNVLKGEMSLVGPRPLLMEYLDRYDNEQRRRHDVVPGITGWAQVNGRNAISWEEKFRLDVWYVDNWSMRLDLKILGMTLIRVFKREGISAGGCATMPEFTGSEAERGAD